MSQRARMWSFGLIWLGQLVSLLGSGMSAFAFGVWIYSRTGSVTQFALVALCGTLPNILLAPIAGALVDRWDRRWAMILSDGGAGLCTLALATLLLTGQLEPWHIYLGILASAVFGVFQYPAYSAAVTLLVPKEQLGRANGLVQLIDASGQLVAPILAGILFGLIGLEGILLIDGISFAFAVTTLLIIRIPRPPQTAEGAASKGSLFKEIAYGWNYIRTRPGLLGMLLFSAAANYSMGLVEVLIAPLVLSFASASVLGIVLSAGGCGMLVGSLIMSVWGGPRRRIAGVIGFTLLQGIALVVGGLYASALLIGGAAFVFLLSAPFIIGSGQAIWQSKVPPDLQGRVFALRSMISWSSLPLAYLSAGPLVDRVFTPLMAPDGALAGSVGRLIGTGPGRGAALLISLMGLCMITVAALGYSYPRVRRVEDELEDVKIEPVEQKELEGQPLQTTLPTHSDGKRGVGGVATPDHPTHNVKVNDQPYKTSGVSMKRLRKIVLSLLAGLLVIVVVAAAAGTWMVRRTWPQTSGSLDLPGLSAPVAITRDQWGVPHISAANEPDLLFAQGFVHAQDRLWQMEFGRRLGSGTLSAAMGEPTLDLDRYMRTFGLRRAAQKDWDQLDPESRTLLERYAAGINAFIETHNGRLPIEFTILGYQPKPWEPLDTLTWGKLMSMNLAGDYGLDLIRAQVLAKFDITTAREILPLPDAEVALLDQLDHYAWLRNSPAQREPGLLGAIQRPILTQGSNSWVVHGSRTTTGKPFLADDTHLSLNIPVLWYENHLQGGRFNSAGISLPGVPLVLIGHNNRISWGATNLSYDIQDLYIERLDNAENPTRYEFEGAWHDLEIVQETIEIKGSEPEQLMVRLTRHGPIINDVDTLLKDGEPVSIRWPDLAGSTLFRAVIGMNLAQNWQEFRDALRYWVAPKQNFVYADVDGNIGYQAVSHVPLRAHNHQGTLPVPGWTGEYEWLGYIPFDELPTHYNPPEGFIIAANSRVSPPDNGKYQLEYFGVATYRTQMLTKMLTENAQVSQDDIRTMQANTFSLHAQGLVPYVLALEPQTDTQRRTLDALKAWDFRYATDSAGPSIFEVWYWFFQKNLLNDQLGEDLTFEYLRYGLATSTRLSLLVQHPQSTWFDDTATPQVETRDDIMRRSLDDATAWLTERYGDDPAQWTWGRIHTMTFVHQPLGSLGLPIVDNIVNSGPHPAPGGDFTINNAWYSAIDPFQMEGGTTQRMIVDLADFSSSSSILATGQTEQIFHPHRNDMIEMWLNVQYHPMLFSSESITGAEHQTLTLTPRP